jgi:hypothetical protein
MIAAAFLLAVSGVSAQNATPSFATEDSTKGWMTIDEPLARMILATGDKTDRELVEDTIKDEGLARNYRQFFRARKISLAAKGRADLFVRPASEPRYAPYYGAHVFRFWFIDAARHVVYASSADKVSLLGSQHEGMHDLLVSQCRSGYCYDTTVIFERGQYRDGSCSTTVLDTGHTSAGCP